LIRIELIRWKFDQRTREENPKFNDLLVGSMEQTAKTTFSLEHFGHAAFGDNSKRVNIKLAAKLKRRSSVKIWETKTQFDEFSIDFSRLFSIQVFDNVKFILTVIRKSISIFKVLVVLLPADCTLINKRV
jgi:hypothetical protein